jgi:thiosulfate dehydrogenase [quinone] large subunit
MENATVSEGAKATGALGRIRWAWGNRRNEIGMTAARVTLAALWLNSFWGKFTNSTYVGGFAATNTRFAGQTSFGWYKDFLTGTVVPNADFFAYLTMYGELLIGVALLLGLLTHVGAFAAVLMNLNFWLAAGQTGSTFAVNIMMGVLAALIIVMPAAKWMSVDRFLAERVFRRLAVRFPTVSRVVLGTRVKA